MQSLALALCIAVGLACVSPMRCFSQTNNYFDDYLSNLNVYIQNQITGDNQEEIEGSGGFGDNMSQNPRFELPLRIGLTSKSITCCSLGHLAGDKGYHCIAQFYAARIMLRNQNRAHNRKLGFHGENSFPGFGTKLMRTFEQCVANKARVFQKCCEISAKDRRTTPHFDTLQKRKWYGMKMKRRMAAKRLHVDENLVGV